MWLFALDVLAAEMLIAPIQRPKVDTASSFLFAVLEWCAVTVPVQAFCTLGYLASLVGPANWLFDRCHSRSLVTFQHRLNV